MTFKCPECIQAHTLRIQSSIELPADNRSDEITLQTLLCTNCNFKGIAIYEESRRGALDAESYSDFGYQTDPKSYTQLKNFIKNCPQPSNKNCACETHKKLGSQNTSGRWTGLSLFTLNNQFSIE